MSEKKNFYNQHQCLLRDIHLALQKEFTIRLFEAHVGTFLSIRVIEAVVNFVSISYFTSTKISQLKQLMRSFTVKCGTVGQADLNGIVKIKINHVPVGIRVEIEIKSGNSRQTEKQKAYGKMINDMGGIYMVARDPSKICIELKYQLITRFGVSCLD